MHVGRRQARTHGSRCEPDARGESNERRKRLGLHPGSGKARKAVDQRRDEVKGCFDLQSECGCVDIWRRRYEMKSTISEKSKEASDFDSFKKED
jgi:hypothetical protein